MTPQQQLHHILREAYDIAGATHQLDAFAVRGLINKNRAEVRRLKQWRREVKMQTREQEL